MTGSAVGLPHSAPRDSLGGIHLLEADATLLFAEHHPTLLRYLIRLTGDPDLAADAAQEAFVRLIEQHPEDNNLRAWLFTVAINVVRTRTSRRARSRLLLQQRVDCVPLGDPPPPPDRAAEGAETRQRVRRALKTLPWKEQTILLMREEGFTHHEIAEAVGTTMQSVGTMLVRARRKLLAVLGVSSPEEQ